MPKTTKVDFDDDWENDDLLKDSFVLEMTPNPVSLNVAQNQALLSLSLALADVILWPRFIHL